MEDDTLSTIGNLMVSLRSKLISSDGMNLSATQSHEIADIIKTVEIEDEDESYVVINQWHIKLCSWMVCKIVEADNPEISFPVKRDHRLTSLACYSAYMSAELVMDELFRDMSYRYSGAKRTIKCLNEAVLACFDLLCKNLIIEKAWDAVSLRDSIIKAADFAIDYLGSQTDKLHFQANEDQDYFILLALQGHISGHFSHECLFSEMPPSTKVTDDDVVGINADLMKIKERLLGSQTKQDIIPIVGMGGIGKTTLVRKIYEDPEIVNFFKVRAWVVVSRKFCERDVLLDILKSIAPLPDEVYKVETEQLAEILYRRLKGWIYFIVLDDIWTTEAWNHIKLCLPDDNNGSRIILTSRITEVASCVNREKPPHVMNFLGIEDSWDLLRKKVFGKDACPHQLINIGMQVAEKCQGLPLAIEVMAGYLSTISKTKECWEDVAKRVGFPVDVTQMESLSNILSISYTDLPHHLKACFLTIVNFPKNFEISVRKLILLWTAMGLLPQNLPKSVGELTLEEVGMKCFENLVDRSLIMIRKKKFDGKAKLCGIHDMLWDLSMRELRKEGHKIFCNQSLCKLDDAKYVTSISQAFLYYGQSFESDCPMNSEGFKLLKVLDILNQSFDHFRTEIIGLVNLRYLGLATSGNIPDLICKLSNLETLLNYHERAGQMLPKEIWLMANLRHFKVGTCTYLSEPSLEGSNEPLLPKLQSLFNLSCSSCTKEVLSNIPNLKKLGIDECEEDDSTEDELLCFALKNLVNLDQLEVLKLCCNPKLERPRHIPEWGSFLPNTIKRLTLSGTHLPWSEMNALGMLPNLEVLKLKENAFEGQEWEMEDEEFHKLKYLLLDSLDLIFWKAQGENFPNLRCLRIRACYGLCRIPLGFGEILSLELIDLDFCNHMIYDSAIEIQEEQMNMGNDKLIFQAGRAIPQLQITGFFTIFVWMAMRLNILKIDQSCQKKKLSPLEKKKLRKRSHHKTGKKKLLVSF